MSGGRARLFCRGFLANLLDKIRNIRYIFPLTESISRSPKGGREDEKLWLFEMLAYNLLREQARRKGFSHLHRLQPIEKARFAKINASKR
jgi:hypothetical protein